DLLIKFDLIHILPNNLAFLLGVNAFFRIERFVAIALAPFSWPLLSLLCLVALSDRGGQSISWRSAEGNA
ncbi:MAG: hypothetical protein AAGJ95_03700, partial [Cyanobacteria bacterium J06554_11]